MHFLIEAEPRRGKATDIAPGVRRIVADNPGPMTYHGTNTYLLSGPQGCLVIDPGPDDRSHLEAVLAAAGGRISRILVTHSHADHSGAARALRIGTGAPIVAWADRSSAALPPDISLRDGDEVSGLTAIHTPGHASDHLCFAGDGFVFTGDHVMSWSSSVVNPPDGNMAAYFRSLELLLLRDDRLYLPGHGPPIPNPRAFVAELLSHRQAREATILSALAQRSLRPAELVRQLYGDLDPRLGTAAERNVVAHLEKLREEGAAIQTAVGRWQVRRNS